MADLTTKAVLNGDATGLVGASKQGVDSLNNLQKAAKGVGDQSKSSASDHTALANSVKAGGEAAKDAADKFKLNTFQVQELTYSARHLFEQLGSGTPTTTILTTQIGHLSAAFGGTGNLGQVFGLALRSVWSYAALAAIAIAGATAATVEYENQVRQLDNTVSASGNPFHLGQVEVQAYSDAISDAANISKSSGRDLAGIFASNGISPGAWATLAVAAKGYATTLGVDVSKAATDLAAQVKDPAKSIDDLNTKFHLLDGTQTQQIKTNSDLTQTYTNQEIISDKLAQALGAESDQVGGVTKLWRGLKNAISDAVSGTGQAIDKLVPGTPQVSDQTGNNAESEHIQSLMAQYDSYGQRIAQLKGVQADLNGQIKNGSLDADDLKNAHAALTGVTFQLSEAEHAHYMQLLALNPAEQERVERLKSLLAGSAEAVAQIQQQAIAEKTLAAAVGGGALATQKANDALDIQRATLPYVTAAATATGKAHQQLLDIIQKITVAMQQGEAAQHYIDMVNEVRGALGGLSNTASVGAMDDALAENVKATNDWLQVQLTGVDTSKDGWQTLAREIEEVYADKMDQVYRDDLNRRQDWVSGNKAALLDLQDAQTNWAAKSKELTEGASKEFEDDFVNDIVAGKNPLQDFFTWYEQQLVHLIYEKYLASSMNQVFGGLTSSIGNALGLGGSDESVTVTPEISLPTLHGGGSVGSASAGRSVDPRLFIGAPRFHDGTLGLNVGERAAILKDDETVYTASQERSRSTAPAVTFNLINRTGSNVKTTQGNDTQNPNGGWSMDVFLDQVDKGLAQRSQYGNSALVSSLEGTHNLKRTIK